MHQPALDLTRTITPETVLDALSRRVGAANGASAAALVEQITGAHNPADERALRECVVLLRTEGHQVSAHPAAGYYLAANADELNATCVFLYERAMTSLRQISQLKRIALPDLAGQLGLPKPITFTPKPGETK